MPPQGQTQGLSYKDQAQHLGGKDQDKDKDNNTEWCVQEQKLLLTAFRKSHMRNHMVPKWMTLTFV